MTKTRVDGSKLKPIMVSEQNYEALKKLGTMGMMFDDVVSDVLKVVNSK
jgi:hypothetical protein